MCGEVSDCVGSSVTVCGERRNEFCHSVQVFLCLLFVCLKFLVTFQYQNRWTRLSSTEMTLLLHTNFQ